MQGPEPVSRFVEIKGANDIRLNENLRSQNASINMGFYGKIDHPPYFRSLKNILNGLLVPISSFMNRYQSGWPLSTLARLVRLPA
jgi:hypothetical protein